MLVARGLAASERAERSGAELGPYALQASIAACHARAREAELTDWGQIAALYEALAQLVPTPVVELNRAVAVAMAYGPAAGLELVDRLADEPTLAGYHLPPSARADPLLKPGRRQTEHAGQLALTGGPPSERRWRSAGSCTPCWTGERPWT